MLKKTCFWEKRKLKVLDQRLLPAAAKYIICKNYREVAKTIKEMAVRGAPAIGVTAAFGMVLAGFEKNFNTLNEIKEYLVRASKTLSLTRPTAVNLCWALRRMEKIIDFPNASISEIRSRLEKEALKIFKEDIDVNKKIGEYGSRLILKDSVILTHCNAGALATAGYGTALGVVRTAYSQGKVKIVYVDETRPYLQGARLTAWELKQEKIPHVLITDSMAGHFMYNGDIDVVIVGADRIAFNGDVANKIGTYTLAVMAFHHKIPFYVAAPTSTVDLSIKSGSEIVIEERPSKEVLFINGQSIAPRGTIAKHPAFDITPASYISAIITEKGVFKPNRIKSI